MSQHDTECTSEMKSHGNCSLRRALGLGLLAVLASCSSRQSIQDAAIKLQGGMTIEEVQGLFREQDLLITLRGEAADLPFATRFFQTNAICEYRVTYVHRRRSFFNRESCTVFFDSQRKIIAYKFESPH